MSVDTSNDNESDSEIIEQNNVFEKTLDAATNFKHVLLASLYAQVEFLNRLEKNLLIRHLSSKTARYYVTIITVAIVSRLQKWQK